MSNVVPKGWSLSTISDTCDVLDSKRIPLNSQDRALRQGIYPYYGANGVQGYIDDFIFEGEHVLLAEDGGYFDEWDSRPISYLVTGRFWVNNHAHILKAKNDHSTRYVHYSLVHKNILKHINGGTRAKLNQSDMREIDYLTPPLPEQKKIAAILSSVDEVIEKTHAQIDKLKDLKTGMMQELLTKGIGHTEFKDSPVGQMPAEWHLVSVGSLAEVIDPQPDHRTPPEVANGIPYIGLGDIGKSGFIDFPNARKVSEEAFNKQKNSFEIHAGAFIFGKIGTIGKPYVLPEDRFYCLSANVVLITTSKTEIMKYLYQIFSSGIIDQQVLMQTNTTSQPALGIKKVRDFLVPIPAKNAELVGITEALNSIDCKISKTSEKLASQVSLKKALMQDLLTGKVRVHVDTRELADA